LRALCHVNDTGTANQERFEASTTQEPPFALFALKALLEWGTTNPNNAKSGTYTPPIGGSMQRRRPGVPPIRSNFRFGEQGAIFCIVRFRPSALW